MKAPWTLSVASASAIGGGDQSAVVAQQVRLDVVGIVELDQRAIGHVVGTRDC